MARKKKPPAAENHERWLISYADFITLLFAFFVVMFASSQTDKSKTQQMQDAVKRALEQDQIVTAISGILGGVSDNVGKGNAQMRGPGGAQKLTNVSDKASVNSPELVPALHELNKELQKEIQDGTMQVSMEPRGLVVSFRQAAFFPSGGDEIPESSFGSVLKVAEVVKRLPNSVRFEGHTDSVPLHGSGRFRSNWELSAARSIAMMELVSECCGIPRDRFSIAGYADTAPVADNQSEIGRKQNRRVDIVILNHFGGAIEPGAARP